MSDDDPDNERSNSKENGKKISYSKENRKKTGGKSILLYGNEMQKMRDEDEYNLMYNRLDQGIHTSDVNTLTSPGGKQSKRALLGANHSGNVGFEQETQNDVGFDSKQAYARKLKEIEEKIGAAHSMLGGNPVTDASGVKFGMHPAFREQISSLRGKLIHVGERFVGFDKTMEELSLMRRSAEDSRYQSITDDLAKLERALNTEVRRRVDYSRTLQIVTENYANEMLDRLQKRLMKQMEMIIGALDSLSARCLTLERGILQFKGELPSKLVVETTALMRRVGECKRDLTVLNRELAGDGSVERRMADLEYKIDHQMEGLYTTLDTEIQDLQQEIKVLAERNVRDETDFQEFTMGELKVIARGCELEEKARKKTDDEIVSAINVYTNALQNGLRAANLR